MRVAAFLVLSLFTSAAAADLYRWVDPETGSVKFSSFPPPWYGNEALQRHAPKVEHIPAKSTQPGSGARFDSEAEAPPKPATERKPPATGERPGT